MGEVEKSANESQQKQRSSSQNSAGRVQKNIDLKTGKLLKELKDRANRKPYGRKLTDSEIIAAALKKVTPDDIRVLQETTYSEKDRLYIAHENYCATQPKISLDDFIGRLIRGEIKLSQSA